MTTFPKQFLLWDMGPEIWPSQYIIAFTYAHPGFTLTRLTNYQKPKNTQTA
jgi:hypothetical protein